ncbi:MAG: DUF4136 domain-containing protein [Pseudomonadales bacterium]
MRITAVRLATCGLCAVLVACATGFKATYDSDPGHNFSTYKTFTWVSKRPMIRASGPASANPLVEPRAMTALKDQLTAKGYRFVEINEPADFAIAFTVGARDKIRVTSYPSTYAGRRGAWGWGGGYYGREVDARQYTEGVLAVDVFDVKKRAPVWHGVASKSITKSDRANATETIGAAVAAILEGFPSPQVAN